MAAPYDRRFSSRRELQSFFENRVKNDAVAVIAFSPNAEVTGQLFLNLIFPGLVRLNRKPNRSS
jgi:hypothetical protein